ncbi:MAG: phytanoyl-CoA dioxygenase family protein [Halioglobus sp.]
MSNTLPEIATSAPVSAMTAALEEFGGVIVTDLLPGDVVQRLNAELDAVFEEEATREQGFVNASIAEFFGDKVSHITGVAGKSRLFVEHVLSHPVYMSACEHFLKPNCADFQLNLAHVLQRCPGSSAQILHRDAWVWKRLPASFGEIQLASIIALSDFSADNGATLVVPGSHRWDDTRYPDADDAVPAVMSSGSAVVYLGNTFHAGGANVTANQVRRGMHVSYTLGWLRT